MISIEDAKAVQAAFQDIETGAAALRRTCRTMCEEHGVPKRQAKVLDRALGEVLDAMNDAHVLTELIGGSVGVEGGMQTLSGGSKTDP
jgi:hypothetical protein